jgi:hypothetical protein
MRFGTDIARRHQRGEMIFMTIISRFAKTTVASLALILSFSAFIEAKNISEKTLAAISEKLSTELKAQFADDSAKVQINRIEKRGETNALINLEGAAFYVRANDTNNRLPLEFEAEVNARTEDLVNVNYTILEDSPNFAPTTTEEFLMKELMTKIGKDYKTNAIVLSIDGFELISQNGGKEFLGTGEIKIKETGWSKIKFNIVLDDANQATKLIYSIK